MWEEKNCLDYDIFILLYIISLHFYLSLYPLIPRASSACVSLRQGSPECHHCWLVCCWCPQSSLCAAAGLGHTPCSWPGIVNVCHREGERERESKACQSLKYLVVVEMVWIAPGICVYLGWKGIWEWLIYPTSSQQTCLKVCLWSFFVSRHLTTSCHIPYSVFFFCCCCKKWGICFIGVSVYWGG